MAGEKILIVDDDADIREILTLYLEKENYKVVSAEEGHQAVSLALLANPNLIILDIMLPGLDGVEVCQEVRKKLNTPIIFLSCKATPIEKSIGLAAGGDDYMGKPFEAVELLARVKAQLRRNRVLHSSTSSNKVLNYPNLSIDLSSHRVIAYEQEVVLSPREFQLLVLLAQNPNKLFSSENLFQILWGSESFGDHRTVMVHISNIRKKIELDPSKPVYIHTVKGAGYKFSVSQL
ncbi:DNA-binding response OmpR family regulator [Desulfitispora alkaliphila]